MVLSQQSETYTLQASLGVRVDMNCGALRSVLSTFMSGPMLSLLRVRSTQGVCQRKWEEGKVSAMQYCIECMYHV